MRCVERHVEQPRLASGRLAHEARSFGPDEVRGVARFPHGAVVVVPVGFAVALVRKIVERAIVVSVETGEAVGQREEFPPRVAEVPLACDATLRVAGAGQQFRQGFFLCW